MHVRIHCSHIFFCELYTVPTLIIVLRAFLPNIVYMYLRQHSEMEFTNIYMYVFLLAEIWGTLGKKINFNLNSSHLARSIICIYNIGICSGHMENLCFIGMPLKK
jgi:hypothetical protein